MTSSGCCRAVGRCFDGTISPSDAVIVAELPLVFEAVANCYDRNTGGSAGFNGYACGVGIDFDVAIDHQSGGIGRDGVTVGVSDDATK